MVDFFSSIAADDESDEEKNRCEVTRDWCLIRQRQLQLRMLISRINSLEWDVKMSMSDEANL